VLPLAEAMGIHQLLPSLLPPVVAAHGRKKLAWALHNSGSSSSSSRQAILTLRIRLCTPRPTVPFKLCSTRFTIKIVLPWQSIRLKGRHLNVMGYNHHRLLFPWPALWGILPILFIWKRHCCTCWMESRDL
jgi:hypothetical protein